MENNYLNNEHIKDPTAGEAIKDVSREERMTRKEPYQFADESEHRHSILVRTIRQIVYLAGFELMDRVQLRDRSNGRVYH